MNDATQKLIDAEKEYKKTVDDALKTLESSRKTLSPNVKDELMERLTYIARVFNSLSDEVRAELVSSPDLKEVFQMFGVSKPKAGKSSNGAGRTRISEETMLAFVADKEKTTREIAEHFKRGEAGIGQRFNGFEKAGKVILRKDDKIFYWKKAK